MFDLKHNQYFLDRPNSPEMESYHRGSMRIGDMGAAFAYAFGASSYAEALDWYGSRPEDAKKSDGIPNLETQVQMIVRRATRTPKVILEIGAGRGEMSLAFLLAGCKVIAVEPSLYACELWRRTVIDRRFLSKIRLRPKYLSNGILINCSFGECLSRIYGLPSPDTVVFCESIEHINPIEFWTYYPGLVRLMRYSGSKMIVTNWIEYYPVVAGDSWDHVQDVNDPFVERLKAGSRHTTFQKGSHLVLEF